VAEHLLAAGLNSRIASCASIVRIASLAASRMAPCLAFAFDARAVDLYVR